MERIELLKELKEKIYNYFVENTKYEWVDIDIVDVIWINLIIVSNKGYDVKKCNEKINSIVFEINSKIDKDDEKFIIKRKEIYNVKEAQFLEIEKPIRNITENFTFASLVDNLSYDKEVKENQNKRYKSKVVSFYSYKGGVGRSVILIQTAYLLAKQGKKVAIIDLDIEAPSFNDIFEDDIKNNNGIINYLFNKLYNINNEDSVVKFVSKLNINLNGEIYIVPAGEINFRYIKKLELLKEKRIYENQYIIEFIKELEKYYNVDYVLIDSRTGLNNWGALSVTDIADEVFLCGYPNKENVKGINLILSLIENKKKCNVIFSRIDSLVNEGMEKAKELFNKLNIDQEFIGIPYDSKIALSDKYPIEYMEDGFNQISEYLLEDEIIRNNIKILSLNSDINKHILDQISNKEKFNLIYTSSEKKILDLSNFIIIKERNQNIEDIIDIFNIRNNYFYIKEVGENFSEFFNQKDKHKILDGLIDKIYFGLIDKTLEKLNMKSFDNSMKSKFLEMDNIDNNEKLTFSQALMYKHSYLLEDIFKNIQELNYFIIDFEKLINKCNDEYIKNNKETYLHVLLLVLHYLNLNQKKVNYKIIINIENDKELKMIEKVYGANILDLTWRNKDKSFINENVKEVLDKIVQNLDGLEFINKNNLSKREDKIEFSQNDWIDFDKFEFYGENLDQKRRLIFANRINRWRYSESLIEWLSNELQKSDEIGKKLLLNIISESANIEKNNDVEKDSIITFNSLKEAVLNFIK